MLSVTAKPSSAGARLPRPDGEASIAVAGGLASMWSRPLASPCQTSRGARWASPVVAVAACGDAGGLRGGKGRRSCPTGGREALRLSCFVWWVFPPVSLFRWAVGPWSGGCDRSALFAPRARSGAASGRASVAAGYQPGRLLSDQRGALGALAVPYG